MKVVLRIVDLLLYTSVFTSCCAVALCMATERLLNAGAAGRLVSPFHLLVFGSSLVVYNTPRLIPWGKQRPSQKYRPWYFIFFFIGILLAFYGMFQMPLKVDIAAAFLSIFAFAYFLPLLPFGNRRRLRDIGWLKISVLATVWTTATAALPIIYLGQQVRDYPFEILLRFIFIFVLCVVFDIRDMRSDKRNNIQTLPNRVGEANSYRLINIFLLLFAALSVVQFLRLQQGPRLIGALLTTLLTWLIVRYIRHQPSDRAYLLLADGAMVLYALLVIWV